MTRHWMVVTLLGALAALSGAQAQETVIDRYRAECIANSAHLRGPGQGEVLRSHVRACVTAKVQARALEVPQGAPVLRLAEGTPSLAAYSGPAKAKGVIYFIRGYYAADRTPEGFSIPPYFLTSLHAAGWDVIGARVPASEPDPGPARGLWMAARAEPFVRERLAALKAQGYRKVVLAGHSWGAWLALLVGRNSTADALIASAPNIFGQRTSPYTGGENVTFQFSLTQFAPTIAAVDVPTVLILPDDNVWDPDPAARAAMAETNFTQSGMPHLVIRPAGMSGHMAPYLPFFDFALGDCIAAFLDAPATQACRLPAITNDDFRSILDIRQVADAQQKRVASGVELNGMQFHVYALDDVLRRYNFVAAMQRKTMTAAGESRENFSFRNGLLCSSDVCSVVIKWSEHEILEFDAKGGKLKAWWVQD